MPENWFRESLSATLQCIGFGDNQRSTVVKLIRIACFCKDSSDSVCATGKLECHTGLAYSSHCMRRRRGQSVPPTFAEIYTGCQSDSVLSVNFRYWHIRQFAQDNRVM